MLFALDGRPWSGALACALLLVACTRQEVPHEPVRAVKLLAAVPYASPETVTYAGEVRARTESQLGFQVAGKLLQRAVQVGDQVQAGQLLAQIDAQDYVLAAQAAQAQLAAAQTQLELAQADWARFSVLKTQGFISGAELDRRRASVQAAQAQWEQAQAQARVQRNQSGYARLLAPADGVVTAVMAEPGQVVSAGQPILRVAHDGPRDVVVAIPETARSQVQVGQPVRVRVWGEDAEWDGEWRELAASADAITRTFAAKVVLQGSVQPALGRTASVQAQLPSRAAAALPRVPSTAVGEVQGQSVVWEFDPQRSTVHARPIEVAGVQGNDVLVASGLRAGMRVVATGLHVLTEGMQVSIYPSHHADVQP